MPRRVLGFIAALAPLAAVVVSPVDAAASESQAGVPLTFDWPLACPATVTQRYYDPALAVDVTYDVEVVEAGLPGVVAIEFGPAQVDSAVGDGVTAELEPQLAAYFTNPVIEVEADGSPVEAVGFEEWLEAFEDAGASAPDGEAALEREITHRVTNVTWESWVGLWSTLPEFEGDVVIDVGDAGAATLLAERNAQNRVISIELVADPATLLPAEAFYEVRLLDDAGTDDLVVAYEWSFDWPACDGARSTADVTVDSEAATDVAVPPGFDTITLDELPPEALDTLALIEAGGPFPYRQDGAVFENREGILPDEPYGYYHEFTVETPGSDDRGARRLVTGAGGEVYYTEDHYDSFVVVVE